MKTKSKRIQREIIHHVYFLSKIKNTYSLVENISLSLFHLGFNDTYILLMGGRRYYVRLYRYGWRSFSEIDSEIKTIFRLKKDGLLVQNYVKNSAGNYISEIRSSEGIRYYTISEELTGENPLINVVSSKLCGQNLANIHQSFNKLKKTSIQRDIINWHFVVSEFEKFVLSCNFVSPSIQTIIEEVKYWTSQYEESLYLELIHGDYISPNIFIEGRDVKVFDFDFLSWGSFEYDLATFFWGVSSQFDRSSNYKRTLYWNKFFEGYNSKTSRLVDLKKIEQFILWRQMWLLLVHRDFSLDSGSSWFNEKYIKYQLDTLVNFSKVKLNK